MKIFNLIIVIMIFSCRSLPKEKRIEICGNGNFSQKIEQISFNDIDRIRQLNGKFVEIEGIYHGYFEDSGLYPSKTSHSPDALWLNSKIPDSLLDKLNKKKVRVIGKVNLSEKGHLNGYLASLDSTFCVKEVED